MKLYPLKDIVKELGYTSRNKIDELSKLLNARGKGKYRLVLGKNLLIYLKGGGR